MEVLVETPFVLKAKFLVIDFESLYSLNKLQRVFYFDGDV